MAALPSIPTIPPPRAQVPRLTSGAGRGAVVSSFRSPPSAEEESFVRCQRFSMLSAMPYAMGFGLLVRHALGAGLFANTLGSTLSKIVATQKNYVASAIAVTIFGMEMRAPTSDTCWPCYAMVMASRSAVGAALRDAYATASQRPGDASEPLELQAARVVSESNLGLSPLKENPRGYLVMTSWLFSTRSAAVWKVSVKRRLRCKGAWSNRLTCCPSPRMQLKSELAGFGFSITQHPNPERDIFGRLAMLGTATASSDTDQIVDEDLSLIGGDGEELGVFYPEASRSGAGVQHKADRSDAAAAEIRRHSAHSHPVAAAPTALPFVPQSTRGVSTVAGSSGHGIGAEERPRIPSYERRRLQRVQRWTDAEGRGGAGL